MDNIRTGMPLLTHREEALHVPASYRDQQISLDIARILRHVWEIGDKTVVPNWTGKGEPDSISMK